MPNASHRYTVLLEWDEPEDGYEGYYAVTVPALPGCFTQGKTLDEAMERAEEAIMGYLEALKMGGKPIPVETPISINTVTVQL